MANAQTIEEAKPQDAVKPGEEDLSMEEILQSIRKIIAEDDNGSTKVAAAENAKANGASAKEPTDVVGSDVLELTDMLKEDGTVVNLKADATAAQAPEPAKTDAPADVLSTIDAALGATKPVAPPVEKAPAKMAEKPPEPPAEKPAEKVAEKPVAPPAATNVAPAATAKPAAPIVDSLLSSETAAVASSSLKHLQAVADPIPSSATTTPSPAFMSGNSVENMVYEMLRPMMKDWLDQNLPTIVERMVEREVKKLTR